MRQRRPRPAFKISEKTFNDVHANVELAKALVAEGKLTQILTTRHKSNDDQKSKLQTEVGVISAEHIAGICAPLPNLAEETSK